jgi:hypothetical protein
MEKGRPTRDGREAEDNNGTIPCSSREFSSRARLRRGKKTEGRDGPLFLIDRDMVEEKEREKESRRCLLLKDNSLEA